MTRTPYTLKHYILYTGVRYNNIRVYSGKGAMDIRNTFYNHLNAYDYINNNNNTSGLTGSDI